MHFIFSKTTRLIVNSILNKSIDDDERKKRLSKSKKVDDSALDKALEEVKSLPIVDFDEYGDIELPPNHIFREHEKCKYMINTAKDIGRQHGITLVSTDNLLTRRGAVISSEKRRNSLESSDLSNKINSQFKNMTGIIKSLIFSQMGVGCLVVIYVILGGLMFDAIESSNERNVKIKQQGNRIQLSERLLKVAEKLFNGYLNETFELKYKHWRDYQYRMNPTDNQWFIHLNSNEWSSFVLRELAVYEHMDSETGYKDTKDQEEKIAEVWTITSAMLYSATVITTIGYGNITPKTAQGKILTMIYALFGIPLMFICLTNTGDVLANVFINSYSKAVNSFCFTCCNERFRKIAGYSSSDLSNIDEEKANEQLNSHQHQHQEKKHVPILATLGALAMYIFGGAVLFGSWEQWQVIDGAYFCFITFTTIGFGDFVPGQGPMSQNKSGKMILCSIFLLVGMIVMAMCFKLMQDELVSKIRTIGKKLGFIDVHD